MGRNVHLNTPAHPECVKDEGAFYWGGPPRCGTVKMDRRGRKVSSHRLSGIRSVDESTFRSWIDYRNKCAKCAAMIKDDHSGSPAQYRVKILWYVSYPMKEMAKEAGARWDPELKKWWTHAHRYATTLMRKRFMPHSRIVEGFYGPGRAHADLLRRCAEAGDYTAAHDQGVLSQ